MGKQFLSPKHEFIRKDKPEYLTKWGIGTTAVYVCMSYTCGMVFTSRRRHASRLRMIESEENWELCPRCNGYAVPKVKHA